MQTADKGIDDAENKCRNDGNVETRMAEQEEDVESDLDNENKSMELEVMWSHSIAFYRSFDLTLTFVGT